MIDYAFKIDLREDSLYVGNFDLNSGPRAVLLNSRQTKTPAGNNAWVVNTIKAVRQAVKHNWLLLTSMGMNTWELPLWACARVKGRQVIIAPLKKGDDFNFRIAEISQAYGLETDLTGWLFYRAAEKAISPKIDWPVRDKLAVELADIILPISIRKAGNLEGLISRHGRDKGKKIVREFETNYKIPKQDPEFASGSFEVAIKRRKWDYVTHWTRTCYGPWPGEPPTLFYQRLAESGNRYPNNALATLKNIIQNKIIYGSSRNLKGGLKGVAFTSLHPIDVVPLMRWRKRYVRWNFEPYGIAISRADAIDAGIQPVIYGKPEIYESLVDSDKPYFQNEGEAGAWRVEKEWRFLGDFDLTSIDPEAMRLIVHRPEEGQFFKGTSEVKIVSMV